VVRNQDESKRNLIQMVMERKVNMIGNICSMRDDGKMNGKLVRGKPYREWQDNMTCGMKSATWRGCI